jgi:hypothetical protein
LARRRSTNANQSMGAWSRRTRSGCGLCRTRTGSSKAAGRTDVSLSGMLCVPCRARDNAMLRDINAKKMVTPAGKREAVVHLCEAHGVSHPLPRQAIAEQSAESVMCCRLIGQRCGICRVVVIVPNYEMQSNAYLVNGVGLVTPAVLAIPASPSVVAFSIDHRPGQSCGHGPSHGLQANHWLGNRWCVIPVAIISDSFFGFKFWQTLNQ